MQDANELINLLKTALAKADSEKKAIEIKNIFSKKYLIPLYNEIKTLDDEQKKVFGQKLNDLKIKIEDFFNDFLKNYINNNQKLDSEQIFDLSYQNPYLNEARPHLLNEIIKKVAYFFEQLNFDIVSGSEFVEDKFNFENLNIPKNHPARNMQDSFFVDDKWLLRTHCTVTTAQKIYQSKADDLRILSYGNVYRRDDDDATHSHQFMQIDFVWINKNLNLANLKWIIDELIQYLFGTASKTRYRLSFFPFTEPSFEVDVRCFKCLGKGCHLCKFSGWIEILGAGMLHKNVLLAANIYDKKGIAAGIGVERLAMIKYGVDDIRDLYNNHFGINKQFRKV